MTSPELPAVDEIATKQFKLVRRGFDPDEVRAFLTQLSDAVASTSTSLLKAHDQLALGKPGSSAVELRAEVHSLQAQVRDLGNRLTVAQALRDDAVAQRDELQALVGDLDVATTPRARGGDELDRASNELAELLRDAKLRAAQIKADAERDASLILERARREGDQVRISAQLQAEQAAVRLQERLAELCREAESRVADANAEAARILADSDETAAKTLERAQFQARRLVANAGTFTAIWLAESEELRAASGVMSDEDDTPPRRSSEGALAAFQASLDSDADDVEDGDDLLDGVDDGTGDGTGDGATDPSELVRQADQLLSIAEVVRRAETDHGKRSGTGSGGARLA